MKAFHARGPQLAYARELANLSFEVGPFRSSDEYVFLGRAEEHGGHGGRVELAPVVIEDGQPDRSDAVPAADHESPTRKWIQLAVLASPVALLAWLAWTHRSMDEDGYIYLHVVQNILAGNGPVFNAGQRVEVFTGPLWTAVLALAGFVTPLPLDWIAVVLGIAMTLGGLSLAILGSVRLGTSDTFLLPLGAIVFVAVCPVWTYASTGLETGLTFLWLGACLSILVRWTDKDHLGRWAMVTLGLGPLVRPELLIDTLIFLGAIIAAEWSTATWRSRARLIAWAFALPIAYQVFRMGYYGEFVANTAIAKEATLPRPGRGFDYLLDFIGPYWLVVPAGALIVGAFVPLGRMFSGDRKLWALLALPVAGVLNAAYIGLMGGDYLHARLLMPAFFAICAPVAAVPLARRSLVSLLIIPWALASMVSLRPPARDLANVPPFVFRPGHGHVTPSQWEPGGSSVRWYKGPGLYAEFGLFPDQTALIDATPASGVRLPTIAASGIGAISYAFGTHVDIFDILGLAEPLDAHLKLEHRGVLAGHEKSMPTAWIIAMLTVPGSSTVQWGELQPERLARFWTPMIPPVSGQQLVIQTAWARAALTCPMIHNLEYGQNGPLTVGKFLSNVWHAFANSTLRVPPNPEAAYHQFCGPGTPASVERVGG
ncbi:MAG: hypothetical protein ABSF84_12670 [Acidimicrobiales bacterium]